MPSFKFSFLLIAIVLWVANAQGQTGQPKQLLYPIDVAVSGEELIVVDRNLPGVFKIAKDGNLSELFRASKKFRTPLNAARCVAISPGGDIVFGDSSTRQIYKWVEGKPVAVLTTRVGIGVPYAMVFDKAGNLYISDLEVPGRIYKLAKGKSEPVEFAIEPAVRGLAIDKEGNLIAVTGRKEAVVKFTPDGKRSVLLGDRPFEFPNSLVIQGDNLYVSDSYRKCVWKVGADLKPIAWCTEGISYPGGLASRGDNVLVTDSKAKKIFSISPDGKASEIMIKQ